MNDATTNVVLEIGRERQRQMEVEGWTPEHDDAQKYGDMALAAAAYAANSTARGAQGDVFVGRLVNGPLQRAGWFNLPRLLWPWDDEWWKPKDARRDLVRAGALIVAEIERLDRAAVKQPETAT